MVAQKGEDVILKIGDGVTPTEGFTDVGGLRVTSFVLNNNVVESNDLASGFWRKLLGGAGISSVSIAGSGYFTDSAAEETLRGYAFAGSVDNYELHFGNGDKLSGAFYVANYSRFGDYDEQEDFSVRLESAGSVSWS